MTRTIGRRLLLLVVILHIPCLMFNLSAQITIGGNVYGGGNEGVTDGSTSVTVYSGDVNAVFGGARMADVKGNAFVHIDGEHASDYIVINKVYGGNDISGTIGGSGNAENTVKSLPTELELAAENQVTKDWDAFVRISTKTDADGKETSDAQKIYIGQLFGGGNGDYTYSDKKANGKYDITIDGTKHEDVVKPELGKTYLEVVGGSIVYAYGGGNNATVTQNTVICVDNPSKVVNSIKDASGKELLTTERFRDKMGINTGFSYPSSDAFQIGRFFGGNNKAEMAIRPTWNLKSGLIRNLYSGGNQGAMTHPNGILLPIKSDGMKIDNVFGGCRMADVNPAKAVIPAETIDGTYYPAGYAARVLIEGGDINNVYGGNDISGNIYGGNAVGIHSSIRGDVYGGGNGSYPYTDNKALKGDDIYGDIYYGDFMTENGYTSSVDALNAFRPNAESVSIRLVGTETKTTIIGGAVYCGGNSATLHNDTEGVDAAAELKIGSYVIADKVFLGNNGANMVKSSTADDILQLLASTDKTGDGTKFNSMDLTKEEQFNKYMDGVTMDVMPRVVFDNKANGDPLDYKEYSTFFGSFYCGGNVGSVRYNGANTINFNDKVVVYEKVVGGSNEANVYMTAYNAQYLGGLLGASDANNGNKLILNFGGLKIQPRRWLVKRDDNYDIVKDTEGNPTYILDQYGNRQLEWNTVKYDPATKSFKPVAPVLSGGEGAKASEEDLARRLYGGNIYGGCYSNGHVEGNVVINLNASIHERDRLFDETDEGDILYENIEEGKYSISKRHTGVILSEQGMDVLGAALNVFGGGYGGDSEIWGSTTINLNKGYTFQIFGGGEAGAIGNAVSHEPDPNDPTVHKLEYTYDSKYSTYINLSGDHRYPGVARGAKGDSPDMAECEFIYGGAFEGLIAGDTHINLGNGRVFNTFAGSCNADILGHTETYVGRQKNADGVYVDGGGFPWVRDHVYGGNDLGGSILNVDKADLTDRIREEVRDMVTDPNGPKASAYMEYTQGRVVNIYGGCFGDYDYTEEAYKNRTSSMPYLHNAFVNIRPNTNANNEITKVFGAGEGYTDDRQGDKAQDRSYVLIDIPEGVSNFAATEIFGAGAYDGLGMRYKPEETFAGNFDLSEATATIDLMRGRVSAAYGGSYEEGITRRTMVSVPEESTIKLTNIFGGAYGLYVLPPCDVYESNVFYRSGKAFVNGAIYGGNNNQRRTLYAKVNVFAPVKKENGYSGYVYGAGRGVNTWSEYTEVNLERGANVWEVYGGGEMGHVLNGESVMKYMQTYKNFPSPDIIKEEDKWSDASKWKDGVVGGELKDDATKTAWLEDWKSAWRFGDYYDPLGEFTRYSSNPYMNLTNAHIVRPAEMDDRDLSHLTAEQLARTHKRYNTNVIIKEGATVGNYAYGGGYGDVSKPTSGDVYGSTYIALLGGTVGKDIYAAGTAGSVDDLFGAGAESGFVATANAYVQGGMVRNVYGGGWRGSVGYHPGLVSDDATKDILGESHVVVGKTDGNSFINGIPAINRNVYGGGEGGGIFGTAYVTINNGRIGYRYKDGQYVEELDDVKAGDNLLDRSGNVFGGGYVANSYVDISEVNVYGGIIRGGLYGGGEIGPIGRGTVKSGAPAGIFTNGDAKIYKAGEARVTLYSGHVLRDVFGGGRGFDNWNGEGYMTDEEKKTMDLSSKGYVFGKTRVRILGGEVGTEKGVADGFGNVFGGGNVGYVYSAEGTKSSKDGYYYKGADLTEDCSVVITPWCKAKSDIAIPNGGGSYSAGEYVPSYELDRLQSKSSSHSTYWDKLDLTGITVHNAVFAGGNVTIGDAGVYANAKTVLGNVSASVVDIFNRDLVTIGTEHVGGIYGDGNLTLVDGYRELNISNYGTDYYGMSDNISLEEYYKLTDREKAYFALEYQCINAYEAKTSTGTKTYTVGQRITEEVYDALEEQYKANWQLWGFCSIYAGRLMNTIQRADFCGVFGSRLVMQGAKDRVPSVADKTDYTVNRVGEVSLNQVNTIAGETDPQFKTHGNYFGIYSVVNYMGGLTSDVDFYETVRTTDNNNYPVDGKTLYQWKEAFPKERKRNNAKVANSVALASGVFLELTTEKGTPENKDWGYVTGVAQLELINVKSGLGGGYVYAKNVHGKLKQKLENDHLLLSQYNQENAAHKKAATNRIYVYDDSNLSEVQTSGNFVHNVKQIIDDCYPTSNAYEGADAAPAHYWFIRGVSYVYDQYITAYTGVSNSYSKAQKIPLNINAASYGKMKLEDVKVNLYAYYYSTEPNEKDRTPLQNTDETKDTYSILVNNDVTYHLNDSISYWDWMQLSEVDQRHFVADTYLTIAECKIGNTTYPEGTVLLPADYEKLKAANPTVYHVAKEEDVDFDYVFRRSNNLSHDLGYVVTYAVDNPSAWSTQDPNCTYSPIKTGVYGQRLYEEGEIIDKTTRDDYESMGSHKPADTADKKQARMAECYVTKQDVKFDDGDHTYNFIAGTPLCKEEFSAEAWASIQSKVEEALVCTGTIEFDGANASKSLIYGEILTTERYNEVIDIYKSNYRVDEASAKAEVNKMVSQAYICYQEGYYGGGYFEAGQKYSALKGWSSLSAEDRENFRFNYDAFNLLIDPDYSGNLKLYDGTRPTPLYSAVQPIDYNAIYTGPGTLRYNDNSGTPRSVAHGETIDRERYEAIPNEQYHYSPVKVDATTMYVVHTGFARGDTPYTVGQVITAEAYGYLTDDQKSHVTALSFAESDVNSTYYYCREDYTISTDDNGHAVTDTRTGRTIGKGSNVAPGVVISQSDYKQLSNLQKNFTIQGNAPEELTTLYVAAQSDVFDLQKDRIITVIFSYDYTESDESGTHIEPISERHIVNIHIHFESGVPEIGTLRSPATALPGDYVGLFQPTVKPGAYEIMGGGWEIFENEEDAERHRNGAEFTNKTPVYWYQDGQFLAYYAKTYLGKTYSNYVPFSVANYHDLKAVMADTEHHLHIDHPDVKRDSKIYINDYSGDDKSGLDLLKDLYDLTMTPTTYDGEGNAQPITSGPFTGHTGLNNTDPEKGVQNMQNLEVFFHANTEPTAYAGNWTPIANGDGQCYNGTIHGEGYTVSGLSQSLIGHLCGQVYNLGVQGSFTSAGLADTGDGYVENCWVKTTGQPDGSVYAVFGNPTDAVSTTRQLENSYYYTASGDYKTTGGSHGTAQRMTERQFYNGEVAYNLNAFYLKKRYNDQASANDQIDTYDYVENRYSDKDIDFLYANGEIPVNDDVRLKTDADGVLHYEPIWPDDYLFFGQSLTYGYNFVGTNAHENVPSHLNKNGDCNTLVNDAASNRVFRTPAYFGNKKMGAFHFNPYAVLAAKSADGQHEAYPGMTAVDFTGFNDKGYSKTLDGDGLYFTPVFDATVALAGVANADETRNVLVYSPLADTDNGAVLTTYFTEPEMAEKEDDAVADMKASYRAVEELNLNDFNNIHGHLVYRDGSRLMAAADHVLVDREDFNCPIRYSFGGDSRMWYQRDPDNYVDERKGWESVSLPFSAELVTTPDKGEITHFYSGSSTGHEYWLREFKGGTVSSSDSKTFVAVFEKPAAGTETKYYTNTFLWDYYYSYDSYLDKNSDQYQKTYYQDEHVYSSYAFSAPGVPYIAGFPGSRYYEFDLSGQFVPKSTYLNNFEALNAQPIIFASATGTTIEVSDDELQTVVGNGYRFVPNYANTRLDEAGAGYVLAADGGSFDKNAAGDVAVAFRPYFLKASGNTRGSEDIERIVFGNGQSTDIFSVGGDPREKVGGTLNIYAKKGHIIVESSLSYTEDVRIVTPAGITVAAFAVKPGDTVEVRADFSGMYIAYTLDGQYKKKVKVSVR